MKLSYWSLAVEAKLLKLSYALQIILFNLSFSSYAFQAMLFKPCFSSFSLQAMLFIKAYLKHAWSILRAYLKHTWSLHESYAVFRKRLRTNVRTYERTDLLLELLVAAKKRVWVEGVKKGVRLRVKSRGYIFLFLLRSSFF